MCSLGQHARCAGRLGGCYMWLSGREPACLLYYFCAAAVPGGAGWGPGGGVGAVPVEGVRLLVSGVATDAPGRGLAGASITSRERQLIIQDLKVFGSGTAQPWCGA